MWMKSEPVALCDSHDAAYTYRGSFYVEKYVDGQQSQMWWCSHPEFSKPQTRKADALAASRVNLKEAQTLIGIDPTLTQLLLDYAACITSELPTSRRRSMLYRQSSF